MLSILLHMFTLPASNKYDYERLWVLVVPRTFRLFRPTLFILLFPPQIGPSAKMRPLNSRDNLCFIKIFLISLGTILGLGESWMEVIDRCSANIRSTL